jgi:hypothetical protein
MSEYQYYEFQALDRPLTQREMAELRRYSSRATITPSRFVNSYSFGSFKGDESTWMRKYFDAFLFLSGWGTRVLMLRVPAAALPLSEARRYCPGDSAIAQRHGDKVILKFLSEDEEGGEWVEEDGGTMASLVPLRAELAAGDLRPLYLAWLACAQAGELDGAAEEPPCPPGLKTLSAPQKALAALLRLDQRLLDVAAAASPPAAGGGKRALAQWVKNLPEKEKTKLLVQLVEGGELSVRSELLQRFRKGMAKQAPATRGARRTAAELLEAVASR